MKKIIKNILIWIFLFIIILVAMFNYSVFRIFSGIDILLITSIMLFFSGMIWTGFIFTFIYSFILDSVFMNYLGINLVSYLLTLIFLFFLCENMDTENLLAKIFIIVLVCLFKIIVYTIFIFLFYWNGNLYFIPLRIFLNIFITVASGSLILWLYDLFKRKGISGW